MAGTVLITVQNRGFKLSLIVLATVSIIVGTIAAAGPAVHTPHFVASTE